MNEKLFRQAEEFARQPYQVHVFADETTDGEPCFVAIIPELPGCMSHGATIDEAIESVREVKADYIYFLIEDGLDLPEPRLPGDPIKILSATPDKFI